MFKRVLKEQEFMRKQEEKKIKTRKRSDKETPNEENEITKIIYIKNKA